jgi:hypothetical protein
MLIKITVFNLFAVFAYNRIKLKTVIYKKLAESLKADIMVILKEA